MAYEYSNPMLAGFYGHRQNQADLAATESEIAGREALARYQESQIEDARLKRALDMQNAPYESRKKYRDDIKGEAELEKAQRTYLVENMGPLLAGTKRGEIPPLAFRAHTDDVIDKAANLFDITPEEEQEMRSWGTQEWQLAYDQSLEYEQQVKAPDAPQNIVSDLRMTQKQWNPETRRMEVVGSGPRFAPPKPPGQKYGVLTNDRGEPTGTYQIGPAGFDITKFPSGDEDGGGDISLPDNTAIDKNIETISGQLGPGPRIKEVLSKNVAPLLAPFLGKGGSNAERDAARTRYRALRANIVDLNKIQGGKSNLYLGLALEGMAETGILENPDRAQNVLTEMTDNLRQAFDAAMDTYQNPNTPKAVAVDSYRQAVGISALFDMLSKPLPAKEPKATNAGKPSPANDRRRIVVDY